jgi:hypothetical protein
VFGSSTLYDTDAFDGCEPKRKKQQLEDAMKYLKELQKLGETTEKPKKTAKRTTKKTTKDEEK